MLRALAPAKINLCLFLGPTRDDGLHELVTLFESLSLADELELRPLPDGTPDRVVCPGVEGENLAQAALDALRRRGWSGPPVEVSIAKRIPIAAGMAGGSADAAATLRLAMALAPERPQELSEIAAALGADVPAQLVPGVSIGTGAGELVDPREPLSEHACLILPSDQSLATPEVYGEADRLGLARTGDALAELARRLDGALRLGVRPPDELLVNDLEPAALSLCPSIERSLADVRAAGCEHAIVCGSGPTVAGIWWGEDARARANRALEALRMSHSRAVVAAPVSLDYAIPMPS